MARKTTVFFLDGPAFHGSSARRAAELAKREDVRLVGLGLGLWRWRHLDAWFPICCRGCRFWRPQDLDESACIMLKPGDRLF